MLADFRAFTSAAVASPEPQYTTAFTFCLILFSTCGPRARHPQQREHRIHCR